MVNLNVSYAAMASEASALRADQQQLEERLASIRSRINHLASSGAITDSASGAFNHSFEQFGSAADQTVSALEAIAGYLDEIAQTLQSTDSELSSGWG